MSKYIINTNHSSLREMDPSDKPREKLQRLGVYALTDMELVMLLIGSGTRRRPVNGLAKDILKKLDQGRYDLNEILSIEGFGLAKAAAVTAALELGRRRSPRVSRIITTPEEAYAEVRHYASRTQEQLVVVMLNGAHEVIGSFVATMGLVNRTIVHPREVFAEPIEARAAAITIAHNHPSGRVEPSEEDKEVTFRLSKAGELLGIKLLDHLVITEDSYYSFLEHGLL